MIRVAFGLIPFVKPIALNIVLTMISNMIVGNVSGSVLSVVNSLHTTSGLIIMTDDLFLIAHKVRGEPAFDIAQHMICPVCEATNDHCASCDGVGHWWIIPTSGHRAYPFWSDSLQWYLEEMCDIPPIPEGLRDHYTSEREVAKSLIDTLGLKPTPTPVAPILRRL